MLMIIPLVNKEDIKYKQRLLPALTKSEGVVVMPKRHFYFQPFGGRSHAQCP